MTMMGGRHEARQWAVQFLFQRDFNKGDVVKALEDFWLDKKSDPKAMEFTEELVRGVESHGEELDKLIATTERYCVVFQTIARPPEMSIIRA